MFSGVNSPESSCLPKVLAPDGDDRGHSLAGSSSLEAANLDWVVGDDDERHPNFCLRDFVFRTRNKDVSVNWPFSQQFLQFCLKRGVRDPLPPFEPPPSTTAGETLESCRRRPPSPTAESNPAPADAAAADPLNSQAIQFAASSPAKSPEHDRKKSEAVKKSRILVRSGGALELDAMVSKVCPVCRSFSSSSNTTLNAHIDRCLSPEDVQFKRRVKPRKTRTMEEICAVAPRWTLEDLDRRNGTNWASELTFSREVSAAGGKRSIDGPVYVDSRGTKVLILSKLDGNFQGSHLKVNVVRKKRSSLKRSKSTQVNGSNFTGRTVGKIKRSRTLTLRQSRATDDDFPPPPPKTRSVSVLTLAGAPESSSSTPPEKVSGSTASQIVDEAQSPTEEKTWRTIVSRKRRTKSTSHSERANREKVNHMDISDRMESQGAEIEAVASENLGDIPPAEEGRTTLAPFNGDQAPSSPLSSSSTISHLSVEEKETPSTASLPERESCRSDVRQSPLEVAPRLKKKLWEAQPCRFSRSNHSHHAQRQPSFASSPILRLMGKNLSVTNSREEKPLRQQNPAPPSFSGELAVPPYLGFTFPTQEENLRFHRHRRFEGGRFPAEKTVIRGRTGGAPVAERWAMGIDGAPTASVVAAGNYYGVDLRRVALPPQAPAPCFPPQSWSPWPGAGPSYENLPYFPRWGGSHEVYYGAPPAGESRVPVDLLASNARYLPGVPWVPR